MGFPPLCCLFGTGVHPWSVPWSVPGAEPAGTGQNPGQNVRVIKQPLWSRDSAWCQALSALVVQMWLGLSGRSGLLVLCKGLGVWVHESFTTQQGWWVGQWTQAEEHSTQHTARWQPSDQQPQTRPQFYSFQLWARGCLRMCVWRTDNVSS